MQVVAQKLDDILASLRPLTVEWQDDTSRRVIAEIEAMPAKKTYAAADVEAILDKHFDDGLLICRLFLGLSKDQFTGALRTALGDAGSGVKRYRVDRAKFIEGLTGMGLLEAMAEQTNRPPRWSDVLVERLRSGRGSAISGQRRGRGVEDFAEEIVKKVFGDRYASRTTFTGPRG